MTNREETMEDKKTFKEIEEVIARAIKKVGGKKENDLCKFLPMTTGGYMHHFTFKKKKVKQPSELSATIEKFIINNDRPHAVAPKQRAARGSRKRRDQFTFNRGQLEKMLQFARQTGDKEMISILSPKKSFAITKRELLSSIRQNRVDLELWNTYVESISSLQTLNALAPEMTFSPSRG